MKRKLMSLALVTALFGTSTTLLAQTSTAATPRSAAVVAIDPAAQIGDLVRLFTRSDVAGLAHALVPTSKWNDFQAAYDRHRSEPTSDIDRARFVVEFGRISSASAVDDLMAEIQPKLDEARPKLPGALLMGFGALMVAIESSDSGLTADQRVALRTAFPELQRWATSTDFLSATTMRQALTVVVDAARGTGITDLDQIKQLPLDEMLRRSGGVLSAVKDAIRMYGIDVDAIADTLKVEVLDIHGESARIRATITVFNAPISNELDLVQVEGKWYGRQAAELWKRADIHDVNS